MYYLHLHYSIINKNIFCGLHTYYICTYTKSELYKHVVQTKRYKDFIW